MRIALLATDLRSVDWFVRVAETISGSLKMYATIEQMGSEQTDIIFWCSGVFDMHLYTQALTLCPNIVWFVPRDAWKRPRMGSPREEPIEPILVDSDIEEVGVLIKYLFPSLRF